MNNNLINTFLKIMRIIYKKEDKTILFEEENESICCYIPNIGEAICFDRNPFDHNTLHIYNNLKIN